MQRGLRQVLSSGAQWQDQRQWAHTEIQEAPSEPREALFDCEGDAALAQVFQRDCRVSVFGDIQKLPGHSPRQLGLSGLAWKVRLDQMTS